MNEPRRGEVWMVDLGMTAKVRPCLVISIGVTDQDRALATLIPHTTSVRNSRFEVKLKVSFLREGAFDTQSLVTIPHAKLIRKIGTLPVTQLVEIERAVAKWLGLESQDAKHTG
jgi:mRNA interferase MazF